MMEERLEIELRKRTADPVAIHRDAVRLLEPDGVALDTVTRRAIDPVNVFSGITRSISRDGAS